MLLVTTGDFYIRLVCIQILYRQNLKPWSQADAPPWVQLSHGGRIEASSERRTKGVNLPCESYGPLEMFLQAKTLIATCMWLGRIVLSSSLCLEWYTLTTYDNTKKMTKADLDKSAPNVRTSHAMTYRRDVYMPREISEFIRSKQTLRHKEELSG